MPSIKKFTIKKYQPGGKVQGPPHAQGGVPVVGPSGQQVAEIEGDERIFSVEDTTEIEQMALAITELPAQEANQAAQQLGFRVVDMIKTQDVVQNQQSPTQPQPPIQPPTPPLSAQGLPEENLEQFDPALTGLT